MSGPAVVPGRAVVIAANAAWNLVNFRSNLIRALLESGREVVAAAPPDPDAEAALRALGCRFRAVTIDSKGVSPWRDLRTFREFRRLFRDERPACFLGYTIKPNVYGALAARACGVPAIVNISGLGTAFIREGWLTRVVERLYRVGLRGARVVFFQNADDLALFVGRGLVRAERAALLPGSGVDTARFAAAPPPARADGVVAFLLIARMLRDKGVVEYVDAARRMKRAAPGLRFRILGFLDAENRTAIAREQFDGWVAEGVIDYLGAAADVRPHIADADAVVLPSYREGTSRVLLEAAAMARPLVATDVPGCREVVDEGVNGFLCRVRDADDLARAMGAIVDAGPARRVAMGAAGRAKVVRDYDERVVIDRYLRAVDAVAPVARR